MNRSSWTRIFRDLIFALLNATLLLVALCLWLALSAMSTAEKVSSNFATASANATDISERLTAVGEEIQTLRAEADRTRSTAAAPGSGRYDDRLREIERELNELNENLAALQASAPEIIDGVVSASFRELEDLVLKWVDRTQRDARDGNDG